MFKLIVEAICNSYVTGVSAFLKYSFLIKHMLTFLPLLGENMTY